MTPTEIAALEKKLGVTEQDQKRVPVTSERFGLVTVWRGFHKSQYGIIGSSPSNQDPEIRRRVEEDAARQAAANGDPIASSPLSIKSETGLPLIATSITNSSTGGSTTGLTATGTGTGNNGNAGPTGATAPTIMQRFQFLTNMVRDSSNGGINKDQYYAARKGEVLYLYPDDTYVNPSAAISISRYDVGIVDLKGEPFAGREGEMFGKRHAVVFRPAQALVEEPGEVGSDAGSGGGGAKGPIEASGEELANESTAALVERARKGMKRVEEDPWIFRFKNPVV